VIALGARSRPEAKTSRLKDDSILKNSDSRKRKVTIYQVALTYPIASQWSGELVRRDTGFVLESTVCCIDPGQFLSQSDQGR
jgi:hypothetical protein